MEPPLDVALVTCAAFPDLAYGEELLRDELRTRGLSVGVPVWDDPSVDWSAATVTVIRSTWDYIGRRDEFLGWAARVAEVTDLHNDADVVRWNTHKGYLMELEDRGVPVVPTAWMGQGDRVDLEELRTSRGWTDVVIKPAVSAGAEGTHLVRAGIEGGQRLLDGLLLAGDVLAQPYLATVEEPGEVSLLFADGEFTHAVRKRPAVGDFRVQEQFEGTTERWIAPGEVRDLAAWILDATGHEYLYARVDLLPDRSGAWQLAELEVVEPALYLAYDEQAASRFADAITARC